MSQTYFAILTAVGEAKLANAAALGVPLQLAVMAVGDGNGNLPVPNRLQTALVREVYEAPLNELKIDPANASQIIAELVIPETEGGYWLREMGLKDAAGDLIAVANCPPSYKPEMAEGSGRTQVLRMVLIVSSTAAVQLKIDPSVVLATRAYADNLIVVHQAAADPHPQYQLRGAITSLSANTQLAGNHEGLLLLSAEAGNRTYTLPTANSALGVRELVLRRTDATTNALVIAASGADKLMLDTTAEAAGQATTELLFAGDFLRLRSDKAGKWWCVGQAELPASIASGRVVFTSAGVHNWQVPPVLRSGRRLVHARATGAGGAGGRVNDSAGSGGAAGGTDEDLLNLTGVTSLPITIGAGGTRQASGLGGNSGGTTSIGELLSATGGNGASPAGQASNGGVGIAGKIRARGGVGNHATLALSTSTYAAGRGGDSIYGGGGRASRQLSATEGEDGKYGGGGAGSIGAANAGNGGDGVADFKWG